MMEVQVLGQLQQEAQKTVRKKDERKDQERQQNLDPLCEAAEPQSSHMYLEHSVLCLKHYVIIVTSFLKPLYWL